MEATLDGTRFTLFEMGRGQKIVPRSFLSSWIDDDSSLKKEGRHLDD